MRHQKQTTTEIYLEGNYSDTRNAMELLELEKVQNSSQNSLSFSLSEAKKDLGPGSKSLISFGSPNGNRTRVSGVRGQYPRPLDDGTTKRDLRAEFAHRSVAIFGLKIQY